MAWKFSGLKFNTGLDVKQTNFSQKLDLVKRKLLWKESLNSGGQEMLQFQQNQQSPQLTEHKKYHNICIIMWVMQALMNL
jgi:hypothetical protein